MRAAGALVDTLRPESCYLLGRAVAVLCCLPLLTWPRVAAAKWAPRQFDLERARHVEMPCLRSPGATCPYVADGFLTYAVEPSHRSGRLEGKPGVENVDDL